MAPVPILALALALALAAAPAAGADTGGEYGPAEQGSSAAPPAAPATTAPRARPSTYHEPGGEAPAPGPGGTSPGGAAPGGELPEARTPRRRTLYRHGHGARFLLEGPWHFRLDPLDGGEAAGLPSQLTLEGWSPISGVPHAWNARDLSFESYGGTVGWYRTDFTLPKSVRGTTWRLRFESVSQRAQVFLNGTEVGRNDGPYIPFEVPLENVRRSKANQLVVRVENRRNVFDVPAGGLRSPTSYRGGWWNYGGILREVYLRQIEQVDIAQLHVRPQLDCRRCKAILHLIARMRNDSPNPRRVRVRFEVAGTREMSETVELRPGGTGGTSAQVTVRRPRLWEPGSPSLYRVTATPLYGPKPKREPRQGGRRRGARPDPPPSHAGVPHTAAAGIRSIKVDRRGRMTLNGRRVSLRGASVHEDHPRAGGALSSSHRKRDLATLQELGATITRAHYPLHPNFLELADRAGILVWSEAPFYVMPHKSVDRASVRAKGLRYLRAMVARDFNHPSIFVWGVANELRNPMTTGQRRYVVEAADLLQGLDRTRLRGIAVTGHPVPPEHVYNRLDAIGVNTYFGWYNGPEGSTALRAGLGPFLDGFKRRYPRLALFVTELGAEANRKGPSTEKGTYDFQVSWLRSTLETLDSKPYVNGALVWILRDFRVRPDWDGGNPQPNPPVNHKGLVGETWTRKPAFAEVAKRFRKMKHLGPVPKPKRRKRTSR